MRRPWPVLVLVVGAVVSIVSLYLPWQACGSECADYQGGISSLAVFSADGWMSDAGQPAALAAILLGGMGLLSLVRPRLVARLPLGLGAMIVGYLTLGVAVGARWLGYQWGKAVGEDFDYAYGAYVGVGIAAVLIVTRARAGVPGRPRVPRPRAPRPTSRHRSRSRRGRRSGA